MLGSLNDYVICHHCSQQIAMDLSWWPEDFPLCANCYARYRQDQTKGAQPRCQTPTQPSCEPNGADPTPVRSASTRSRTPEPSRSPRDSASRAEPSLPPQSRPSGSPPPPAKSPGERPWPPTAKSTASATSRSPGGARVAATRREANDDVQTDDPQTPGDPASPAAAARQPGNPEPPKKDVEPSETNPERETQMMTIPTTITPGDAKMILGGLWNAWFNNGPHRPTNPTESFYWDIGYLVGQALDADDIPDATFSNYHRVLHG